MLFSLPCFHFVLAAIIVHTEDATASRAGSTMSTINNLPRIAPLPRLRARGGTSISGISSGADFAVYFAIAHSASIAGAAIFAGNVYRCYTTRFPGDDVVP